MSPDPSPALALHREGTFSGKRGRRIYWQAWLPEHRPTALIVIAHGACEHSGRYSRLAQHLVTQGYAVYALDHRGHGRSQGSRALFERFAYAVEDLDHFVNLAAKAVPHCKPLLLGHSLGGLISVSYALKHQDKLQGLILSAPAIALTPVPMMQVLIARLTSTFAPNTPLYSIDTSGISRDPEEVIAYEADPLNYRGKVPARTMIEVLNLLGWLPMAYPSLKLPLMAMHGTDDRLAPDIGSRTLIETAGSNDKTLKLYEGFFHELFNEPPADRQRVYDDLDRWIAAHIGHPS